MLPLFPNFIKPVLAISGASMCWMAETVASDVPGTAGLIKDVGLPVTFLILVIYGLVALYKELTISQKGRLADRDLFQAELKSITEKASDSRERLIRSNDEQTAEFRRLAEQLQDRPCQIKNRPA